MEIAHITITRVIQDDGEDTFFAEFSEDLGFIEALGLLEATKDTAIRYFMGEGGEED